MGVVFLERDQFVNVQRTEFILGAEELLRIGCTSVGSTSLTWLYASSGTLGQLVSSDLVGIWSDRPEVQDLLGFSRKLRAAAQRRTGEQH